MKLNVFYRNDQDNLLNFYYYTSHIQNFGVQSAFKFNKSLSIRLGYNPILQKVNSKDGIYKLKNTNKIS